MKFPNRPKLYLAVITSLAVLYLVLAPANSALYDTVLFPCPDPRLIDVASELAQLRRLGISTKEIQLTSANGKHLFGWFIELPYTKRVFLYSHGKGNNITGKLHVARSLLGCGGSVLMYDYQGYGRSQGRATIQNACDDAVAAYDYLIRNEHRTAHDIIGYGESFGSGVTGQLVERRHLGGVVFQSGFASLKSAACDTLFWLRMYPDWAFPPQMMNNVAVFSKQHPPLLMIHGTKDHVVSYSNALALYNKAIPPKVMLTIPGGNHGSNGGVKFFTTVKQFLGENNI
jgi:uncharacterized protein